MTQRLAYWIGGLVLCVLTLDVVAFGSENLVFLGKKMLGLIHWLAFWR